MVRGRRGARLAHHLSVPPPLSSGGLALKALAGLHGRGEACLITQRLQSSWFFVANSYASDCSSSRCSASTTASTESFDSARSSSHSTRPRTSTKEGRDVCGSVQQVSTTRRSCGVHRSPRLGLSPLLATPFITCIAFMPGYGSDQETISDTMTAKLGSRLGYRRCAAGRARPRGEAHLYTSAPSPNRSPRSTSGATHRGEPTLVIVRAVVFARDRPKSPT